MGLDYDFKYNLRVKFNGPDDVLALVSMLADIESDMSNYEDFHPALVKIGSQDHLCLVETDGVLFSSMDGVELHSCGYNDDIDILDDMIKMIKDEISGVSIDGYATSICNANEILFTFYKNSTQIDCLNDDEIAEMYERDVGIIETKEE